MERQSVNTFLNVAATIATIAAVPFLFGNSRVVSLIAVALALALLAARFLPVKKSNLPINLVAASLISLVAVACIPFCWQKVSDGSVVEELSAAEEKASSLTGKLTKVKEDLGLKDNDLTQLISERESEKQQFNAHVKKLDGKNNSLLIELKGKQQKLSNMQLELEKLKKTLELNSAPGLVTVAGDEVVAIEIVEFIGDGRIEAWLDEETNKIMNTPITGRVSKVWQPSADTVKNLKDRRRNQFEHTLPYIKTEVDNAVAKLASSGWSSASIEPVSFSREFSSGKHVLHFRVTPSKAGSDWNARVNITKLKNKEKHVVTTFSLSDSPSGASEAKFEFFVPPRLNE